MCWRDDDKGRTMAHQVARRAYVAADAMRPHPAPSAARARERGRGDGASLPGSGMRRGALPQARQAERLLVNSLGRRRRLGGPYVDPGLFALQPESWLKLKDSRRLVRRIGENADLG